MILGLATAPLFAQSGATASQPATPSANANTVTITATVRDKHGKLVPNLTRDDFTLLVDGNPQAIGSVTSAASVPMTMGLLEQTSLSQPGALDATRAASQGFVDHMLTGGNKAFVIQFDREVDLLADVSANKAKLDAAINQLGSAQTPNTAADQQSEAADNNSATDPANPGSANPGPANPRIGGSGTPLYDAIYLASNEVIEKQPGRRVLILVTDGVDRGSKVSLFSAIEAAQRANTAVYAVYFKGDERGGSQDRNRHVGMGRPGGYPGGGYPGSGGGWPGNGRGGNRPTARPTEGSRTNGKKILEQICGETGGRMFEVGRKTPVDQLFPAIAEELGARYFLNFTPGKQSAYPGFHRVALTAKQKDDYVQARQGYYSGE